MEENTSYWLKLSIPITLACFLVSRRINVGNINYLVPGKKTPQHSLRLGDILLHNGK